MFVRIADVKSICIFAHVHARACDRYFAAIFLKQKQTIYVLFSLKIVSRVSVCMLSIVKEVRAD